MHKAWLVYLDGKPISTMVGEPKSHDQALASARFHWPQAEVKPR